MVLAALPLRDRVVPGCGAVVLATGSVLSWIRANPDRAGRGDAVPDILLPKMTAGVEPYGLALLAAAVVAVTLSLVDRYGRPETRAAVVLLAGVVAVLLPIQYLASTSLVGFDDVFVPAPGWYLTICGGLLLAAGGVAQLAAATRRPEPVVDR